MLELISNDQRNLLSTSLLWRNRLQLYYIFLLLKKIKKSLKYSIRARKRPIFQSASQTIIQTYIYYVYVLAVSETGRHECRDDISQTTFNIPLYKIFKPEDTPVFRLGKPKKHKKKPSLIKSMNQSLLHRINGSHFFLNR